MSNWAAALLLIGAVAVVLALDAGAAALNNAVERADEQAARQQNVGTGGMPAGADDRTASPDGSVGVEGAGPIVETDGVQVAKPALSTPQERRHRPVPFGADSGDLLVGTRGPATAGASALDHPAPAPPSVGAPYPHGPAPTEAPHSGALSGTPRTVGAPDTTRDPALAGAHR